ncbi:hypothetical protein SAY87_018160 [Trapa incisa]|uniref:Uncharacterized protein n=1 Tax=Trapa incisa TaxID=236973 RepID=A0AAN7KX26_9MYRT|nr:hypothetical protein SAY87_018160 [Trapa incisa]
MTVVDPMNSPSPITEKIFGSSCFGGSSNHHVVAHRRCSRELNDDVFEECDGGMESSCGTLPSTALPLGRSTASSLQPLPSSLSRPCKFSAIFHNEAHLTFV